MQEVKGVKEMKAHVGLRIIFTSLTLFTSFVLALSAQQVPPPTPPAQTPQPQTPPPQFRSKAEIVRLDVSVIGQDRMPVRDLTMEDFIVVENNKPQSVTTFLEVQVADPVVPTTPWIKEVEPDIRRNDDINDRRLILIMMDDAQVQPMNVRIANNVKTAGRAIINQLGPADLCAVVYTLDQRNMQEFTSDRSKLLAAIDRFSPGGGGAAMAALYDQYSVGALMRAAEYLAEIPNRRKAMFYISTGVAVDVIAAGTPVRMGLGGDQAGRAQALIEDVNETFRQAQMANVNIHAIDPSALEGGIGGFGTPAKDFLVTISENTGGFPIVNRDDYQQAIAQVFLENSSYYLLGYEPTVPDDGKYRRLDIKIKNRPELTVRHRSGYYAPDAIKPLRPNAQAKAGPSPLVKAMSGILPVGDLPLQVMAAPFAIPGKKEGTVAIVLGIVHDADTGDTRHVEKIEFLIDAFGQDGSKKSEHGLNAEVTLKPNVKGKIGYEVLSRIDLKPGRYQLRLSAHLPGEDKSGSIYYDVDVPDFSKGPLQMSGAMISVTPSVHASPRDKLADILPIVPTTTRHFNSGDVVSSFVKVYQPGRGSLQPVIMASRITDSLGAVITNRVATLPVLAFGDLRVANWRFPIPAATLKPGLYLLTFEATLGTAKMKREVRFTVRSPGVSGDDTRGGGRMPEWF